MTIPQALAKYPIQLSAQLIRVWAQSEKGCPFCYIIRDGDRKSYYVNEEQLKRFLNGESTK
jgi:hypothetical protein